jgi:hypothetical protein
MKKTLLLLLIILGLQTKAQVFICDSVDYSIQNTQQGTDLILNGSANIPGVVTSWSWQACHSTLCFSASGQSVTFNQFVTTDTIKLCLITYLDINGITLTCNECDSLVWNNGWILLHSGTPVSIYQIDGVDEAIKLIYDLFGRPHKDDNSLPKGTLYIKNKNKFIK